MANVTAGLPDILAREVGEWRRGGYASDFPLIGAILRFQQEGEAGGDEAGGDFRYLRAAQFAALETYWYLRLARKTASVLDIYGGLYPEPHRFVGALGVPMSDEEKFAVKNTAEIVEKIKDPEWAAQNRLDALHEAATLPYPGYIFALAMGAGKTVLIGAIIATEFAMAMRYDGGRDGVRFMQNALVFAPRKTIIESLREISDMPMEKILPAESLRDYQATVSVVFPADGQKEIGVITGGFYNIIVSNTEKISLRAAVNGKKGMSELQFKKVLEQKTVVANARLQKIISLPNLGVFSDEAHHTYGNNASEVLKRVRETVNYIHEKTPLTAVVNTTGTPYYRGRMLPDVVFWYGLRDGIRDNVLKGLRGGVVSYSMREGDEAAVLEEVVADFFKKYGDVRLPNGAAAKIAFYFRTQEHLDESRPHIEAAMFAAKRYPTEVLVRTQQSSKEEVEDFKRLNDSDSQKRVILLVQIGTEGWNCPSLFACALIKRQTSDIFVLQSATRCLRQMPSNDVDATVYLSDANKGILERALKANFGHGLDVIKQVEPLKIKIKLREVPPPVDIVREVRYIRAKPDRNTKVKLTKPAARKSQRMVVEVGDPDFFAHQILHPTKSKTIDLRERAYDCYMVAARLAANYHLKEIMPLLQQLKHLYPDGDIPVSDVPDLMGQIEQQTSDYEEVVEKQIAPMHLIRLADEQGAPVFDEDAEGNKTYTLQFSERVFSSMVEKALIVAGEGGQKIGEDKLAKTPIFAEQIKDESGRSYHYSPYCFDSVPEREFFARVVKTLGENPEDISTFVFTGLANSRLTDFWFYYKGEDGAYHRYFPDFLLRKNSGEFLVVEIKSARERGDPVVEAKKEAVEMLAKVPGSRFRYVIIYVAENGSMEAEDGMLAVRKWIEGKNGKKTDERKESQSS